MVLTGAILVLSSCAASAGTLGREASEPLLFQELSVTAYAVLPPDSTRLSLAQSQSSGDFAFYAGTGYRKTGQDFTWQRDSDLVLRGLVWRKLPAAGTYEGWTIVEGRAQARVPVPPAAGKRIELELSLDELADAARNAGYAQLSRGLLSQARKKLDTGTGTLWLVSLEWQPGNNSFKAAFMQVKS